jgi:hypothetical protein
VGRVAPVYVRGRKRSGCCSDVPRTFDNVQGQLGGIAHVDDDGGGHGLAAVLAALAFLPLVWCERWLLRWAEVHVVLLMRPGVTCGSAQGQGLR